MRQKRGLNSNVRHMADTTQQVKDIEALLNSLLPFAEQMLTEHQEFLPFGGRTALDGEIILEGAKNEHEMPLSADLIAILHDKHRELAAGREIRACAVVYDIRVTPPGCSEKQDAICAVVDHATGYSASIIYPYTFTLTGELTVEESYAIEGMASVFPRANA